MFCALLIVFYVVSVILHCIVEFTYLSAEKKELVAPFIKQLEDSVPENKKKWAIPLLSHLLIIGIVIVVLVAAPIAAPVNVKEIYRYLKSKREN